MERLKNKIIINIEGLHKNSDKVYFTTSDGIRYKMYHNQECCEDVYIDDIVGDPDDLLNSPITMAEVVINEKEDTPKESLPDRIQDYYTWTFYKLATVKGYVTIKWFGTSNGYYSEKVNFEEVNEYDD